MTIRVTQQAAEVLLTGDPKVRATQQAIEVLRSTYDAWPVTVAIANPGAESFATGNEPSSWTETSGDWESLTSVGGDFPIAGAKAGSRFFYQQGAVVEAVLEQTVELYNVPKDDLDAGGLTARLAAWQAHNYPDDEGQVIAEFLDSNGLVLGTIATPLQHVGTSGWVEVTASGAVPPGARQVRIKLRAVLVEGSVPMVGMLFLPLIVVPNNLFESTTTPMRQGQHILLSEHVLRQWYSSHIGVPGTENTTDRFWHPTYTSFSEPAIVD